MLSASKIPWLELCLIPDMGPVSARKLLSKFKTPANILKARHSDLVNIAGIKQNLADNIVKRNNTNLLDKQIKLIDKYKANVITINDQSYPETLRAIYGAPFILFVQGDILADDYFSVAVVGTRACSSYGIGMSDKISSQLSRKGITIISGGARGIDTSAHKAALRNGGRTIVVLGCGLDIAYPPENNKLFFQIREKGVMISEYPFGTSPNRINFPMRNRIVSGLSLGVLVIEAPQRSGALITARYALEHGKEVFSVPHKAGEFSSCGTNHLIRQGAKLVETADDVIEELAPVIGCKIKEIKDKEMHQVENI
ncbi:MAG TPA: DNA-protecting protein DprA [Candidatus Omnitrophica bacterium]|nr:DNA-protecting protein DprA [Candidatus Omnitrophota bacterium]